MKISTNISLLLAICLLAPIVQGQEEDLNWKKHIKLAEELYAQANYLEAGEHYRAAWKQKTKDTELIYKAGECFNIIRDYKNAADAYQHLKDDNEKHPLVGLKYARSLKQSGDYEAASTQLSYFNNQYQGNDKRVVSRIVQTELKGAALGLDLVNSTGEEVAKVEHLGPNINTPETEFAPFPFNDKTLYFSSTVAKRAEIYRSQKVNGSWKKAKVPKSFPVIEKDHYCNGTLTPDQKRFYFTICKSIESWGGLTTQCEIYVTRRIGKNWSAPQRLRDYINVEGVTTTHPYVVHQGNTEILYFASNREGGKGGMDIWFTTRDINSNDLDFTMPVNAGNYINTIGDEITPYYDSAEEALYFASNGLISLGGYDIFKAVGNQFKWEKPQNLGKPFNSSADDFFFIKTPSKSGGFFVSNRLYGMEKITTTDEDIFSFTYNTQRQLFAKGGVYSKIEGERLRGVTAAIYELLDGGRKKLIANKNFDAGQYYFDLKPARQFVIEAQKEGYLPGTYEFDTYDYTKKKEYGAPIYLENYQKPRSQIPNPVTKVEEALSLPNSNSRDPSLPHPLNTSPGSSGKDSALRMSVGELSDKAYTTRGKSRHDNYEIITSSPRHSGTYYKIQLIAVVRYNPNHSRYKPVKNRGRLDTEFIVKKKLTRVLLAEYDSLAEAKKNLAEVQKFKNFERAFIVKYEDGERIGRVR